MMTNLAHTSGKGPAAEIGTTSDVSVYCLARINLKKKYPPFLNSSENIQFT